MPRHRTLTSLASALGYVPSAVTNWRKNWSTSEDPFPPKHADGYDEDEVRSWHRRQQQRRADVHPVGNPEFRRGPGNPNRTREPPSENLEKVRKFTAQIKQIAAMRDALRLKREEGLVIDRPVVEQMLAARIVELNQLHEMMHRDIAPKLSTMKDVRAIVALLDAQWLEMRALYGRPLPLPEVEKNGHVDAVVPKTEPKRNPTRDRRRRPRR